MATVIHRPAASPGSTSSGRVDVGGVILSWAAFAIGTLMLFEAIAYLGFGTVVGLPGILAAAAVGAVLTFVFRDNMRRSDVRQPPRGFKA